MVKNKRNYAQDLGELKNPCLGNPRDLMGQEKRNNLNTYIHIFTKGHTMDVGNILPRPILIVFQFAFSFSILFENGEAGL